MVFYVRKNCLTKTKIDVPICSVAHQRPSQLKEVVGIVGFEPSRILRICVEKSFSDNEKKNLGECTYISKELSQKIWRLYVHT